MKDYSEQRFIDLDVTPPNRRALAYLLPRAVPDGEHVIAEFRAATNLAYDFLASEYGAKGNLGRHPLLAAIVSAFSLPAGGIMIRIALAEGTSEDDIEAFRIFCRDGISARIPPLPACICGVPSETAWAGRAACWDHAHAVGVYEGHPPRPSTKDAQAA